MRDEDERGAVSRDLANALHEGVPRHEVEPRRRLVEYEHARSSHKRAGEQDTARLAARHLMQPPAARCAAHPLECFRGAAPHVRVTTP